MSKKKRTLFLVLLVALIYAAVAVRFFMLSDGDSNTTIVSQKIEAFTPEKVAVVNHFSITNNYRDPFLGVLPTGLHGTLVNQKNDGYTKKDEVIFPLTSYKGLVADASDGKQIFTLEIENEEYIVAQGKKIREVRVVSGNEKAISLEYKGSRKVYAKHQ